MASQTDLDQGGIYRRWEKQYMGPSVGWVWVPGRNQLPITAAGTTQLDTSTSYVPVLVAGAVTIILPSLAPLSSTQGAQPGAGVNTRPTITVVDVGANAAAFPITIQAAAGDTIVGLASIQITSNDGGFNFTPNAVQREWSNIAL